MSTNRNSSSADDRDPFSREIRRMGWIVALCLVAWGASVRIVHQFLEARNHAPVAHARD
jgi:hypothetical protein